MSPHQCTESKNRKCCRVQSIFTNLHKNQICCHIFWILLNVSQFLFFISKSVGIILKVEKKSNTLSIETCPYQQSMLVNHRSSQLHSNAFQMFWKIHDAPSFSKFIYPPLHCVCVNNLELNTGLKLTDVKPMLNWLISKRTWKTFNLFTTNDEGFRVYSNGTADPTLQRSATDILNETQIKSAISALHFNHSICASVCTKIERFRCEPYKSMERCISRRRKHNKLMDLS